MMVSELMARDVVSVAPTESAAHAAHLMERYNVGAVPVTGEDGRLLGIVTDRDLVTRCIALGSAPQETSVGSIMSKNTVSVSARDDVREAVRRMAGSRVRRLPVLDGDKTVGMLSLGDVSSLRIFDMEASLALSEISSNIRRL